VSAMKIISALAGISIAVAVGTAYGQIVTYNFTTDATPSTVTTGIDTGLSSLTFSAGAGVSGATVTSGRFEGSSFDGSATAAAGQTAENYFTFTVTADVGFQINLTSLSFDINSSSSPGRGPDNVAVFFSRDGGAFSQITLAEGASITRDNTPTYESKTDGLSQTGANSLTFRFVGFGTGSPATQASGLMQIDNVQLDGLVIPTPVPEPEHFAAIAGLALVGFGAWRRLSAKKA
jgi:hypothetical protein